MSRTKTDTGDKYINWRRRQKDGQMIRASSRTPLLLQLFHDSSRKERRQRKRRRGRRRKGFFITQNAGGCLRPGHCYFPGCV